MTKRVATFSSPLGVRARLQAALYYARQRRLERVVAANPEAGLNLTAILPKNTDLNGSHSKAGPVVYAADFTGLEAETGNIWDSGGFVTGASLVCNSDGNLRLRGGAGGGALTGASSITVPMPTGDGTLVWEFANSKCHLWWNGEALGTCVGSYAGDYAGGNESYYLGYAGQVAGGQVTDAFTGYTTASNLRYYENQRVRRV